MEVACGEWTSTAAAQAPLSTGIQSRRDSRFPRYGIGNSRWKPMRSGPRPLSRVAGTLAGGNSMRNATLLATCLRRSDLGSVCCASLSGKGAPGMRSPAAPTAAAASDEAKISRPTKRSVGGRSTMI